MSVYIYGSVSVKGVTLKHPGTKTTSEDVNACMHACLLACLHACMHACIGGCINQLIATALSRGN